MPTNLFEYYKSIGQPLPSVQERAPIYESLGLGSASTYTGGESQNIALLNKLLSQKAPAPITESPVPAPTSIPVPVPISPLPSPAPAPIPKPISETQPIGEGTGSIVDYLKSIGQPSDFASRMNLAQQAGIQSYTGTAQQNIQLLNLLKNKPAPKLPAPDLAEKPVAPELAPTEQGTDLSSLMSQFGLTPAVSLDDIIKNVSVAFGLDKNSKELKELDEKYIDDVVEVNRNPWLTEGIRQKEVSKLKEKYEAKKDAYIDRLKLQQDVVGKAIDVYYKERELKKDLLFKQLDLKQKELDRLAKEEKPVTTSDITEYNLAKSQGFRGTFLEYQTQKSTNKPTETEKTRALKVAAFAKARPELEKSRGRDGYVDPGVYSRLRNNYVEAIGDVTEFDEVFAPMLSVKERLRLGVGKTI